MHQEPLPLNPRHAEAIVKALRGIPTRADLFRENEEKKPSFMNQEQAETRIKQNKDWRQRLDAILQEMKDAARSNPAVPVIVTASKITGSGRHRSLSITHLEDSIMRLGMDCKEVNEQLPGSAPNPYPQSYNPANAVVEPTADALKL